MTGPLGLLGDGPHRQVLTPKPDLSAQGVETVRGGGNVSGNAPTADHRLILAQSGADQQTTIEFVDSFTSCRDNTVSLSYSGTISGDKIVRDAAQIMGCEVKFSKSAKLIDFTNFAFVGAGKTLIERVCNRSKMRWSLQNGIVQICALDEPITMAAYVLSASTGLIGSPKPVFESASTSDKKSSNASKRKAKKGIEVTYVLNGHIQVDDYVKIDSKSYKGNYRASKIKFTGDTEGDDWKCVALFVEVK